MEPAVSNQQPEDGANATVKAIMPHIGMFVHSFGSVELSVAAWLVKLEERPEAAVQFLTKTRALAARISRLTALLRRADSADAAGVIAELEKVGPYRLLRNDLAHGALTYAEGGDLFIISWKARREITPKILSEACGAVGQVFVALATAYMVRFGELLNVNITATVVPPAED